MIVQYDGASDRNPRTIQDIVPRQADPYVDVRRDRVRHQSIGFLDQQYLYSRWQPKPFRPKIRHHEQQYIIDVRKPLHYLDYTYVRPLQSMPELYREGFEKQLAALLESALAFAGAVTDDLQAWLRHANRATRRQYSKLSRQVSRLKPMFTGAALAVMGWLEAIEMPRLHKRYTLSAGLLTDWPFRAGQRRAGAGLSVKHAKYAVPVLLALLIAVAAALAWPTQSNAPGTAAHRHSGGNAAAPATTAASNRTASPSPAAPKSSSPVMSAYKTSSPASGAGTSTGKHCYCGGAPTTSPTSSTSSGSSGASSPTPTPSTTVPTLPATSVSTSPVSAGAGGQNLVNTNGTGIALP